MKWLVPLTLAGAIFGGIYPGAFAAFLLTASLGSEIVCFITNLLLSVFAAFVGMMEANEIHKPITFHRLHVVLPLTLGILCGIAGYFLADWAISHADPPL